jgi:hypothetical protein
VTEEDDSKFYLYVVHNDGHEKMMEVNIFDDFRYIADCNLLDHDVGYY